MNQEKRKKYYHTGRLRLLQSLGGVCILCGEDDTAKLEFHHNQPRTWIARKKSRWQRLALYKREAKKGLIDIMCGSCNKRNKQPSMEVSDEPLPD